MTDLFDNLRPLRPAAAVLGAVLLVAALAPAPVHPAEQERAFTEVTAETGIDFVHRKAEFDEALTHIMDWMNSINAGVAAADYDGDGDTDLYFLSSRRGEPNALYRNDGELRFVEVGEAAGLAAVNDADGVSMDALFADWDGDGDQDLYLAAYGRNRLFRNRDGRFEEVGEDAGVADRGNAAAALALDYDRDGHLDLLVGNYYADEHDLWRLTTPKILQTTFETARNGGTNRLYRNLGDGRFEEVGAQLGLDDTGWTLALGGGDLDDDGDTDVYVANDFGYDRLYRNDGDRFTDVFVEATGARDTSAGMNVELGDWDNDGDLDIYVTNISNAMLPQGNMLWSNEGGDGAWLLVDRAERTRSADTGWGWGAKFLDFDHDADLDLFVVNGFVSAGEFDLFRSPRQLFRGDVSDIRGWPDMRGWSLSGYERSRLLRNDGPSFVEVGMAAGIGSWADGRGVALADLDLDGDLEVVVSNSAGSPEVYRNDLGSAAGGWLEVDLVGRAGNRDGIGARLRLAASGEQVREVDGGNGFSGQSWKTVHFGLADAAAIDHLSVRWPSGRLQRFVAPPRDRLLVVFE